jgi:serine/threonine-protein kinase RsbT
MAGDPLPITSEQDILVVRQTVRRAAQDLAFSLVDQTKIVTATSELARNSLIYGGGGRMTLEVLDEGTRRGLRLTFADDGPGIPDVELAMRDGWTSGNGLGMGLSGTKRLVNEFAIDTRPGAGTRVTIVKWRHA